MSPISFLCKEYASTICLLFRCILLTEKRNRRHIVDAYSLQKDEIGDILKRIKHFRVEVENLNNSPAHLMQSDCALCMC